MEEQKLFSLVLILVTFLNWSQVCSWNIDSLEDVIDNADSVDLVFPYALSDEGNNHTRKKRTVSSDEGVDVPEKTVFVVKNWVLEVESNPGLVLDSDLQAEWVGVDGEVTRRSLEDELRGCSMKRGAIRGEEGSLVALSICGDEGEGEGEMTGMIQTKNSSFFIIPIDGGLDLNPHLIYKAKENLKFSFDNDQEFSKTNVKTFYNKFENENGQGFSRNFENNKHDSKLFPNEKSDSFSNLKNRDRTKRESYWSLNREETRKWNVSTIPDDNDASNIPFVDDNFRFKTRFIAVDDEEGYFVDSSWAKEAKITRDNSLVVNPQRWLEVALAADYSVIAFHTKSKVLHNVLALMNIVSAIYNDPSLASNLKIVIVRMLLFEDKQSGYVTEGNSKRSLESVNRWNERLLGNTAPSERHDMAIWLTRLDLGGPSGYAPVAGACDPARSCTLNRDEGMTSSFIIAHEMAHVLGLTHDGDTVAKNDCGKESQLGSVMAPMVAATFHRFTWSSCSKREFHNKASQWHCLSNPPRGNKAIILKSTVQATFSMDEQCRMEFGEGYSLCRGIDLPEPCTHLWCGHFEAPQVCKTKKGPPLEGTECGVDKWCVNGYCEVVDRRRFGLEPVHHNPRDGGWTSWSNWTQCSRSCGVGVAFRSRRCENPRPAYGGDNCVGRSEEFRVCGEKQCAQPRQDIRAQQCARLPILIPALVPLVGPQGQRANQTWLPYEPDKDSHKCQLICVSRQTGEVLLTGENVLDGTPCSYDRDSDICIQGECQSLGCDAILDSPVKRDSCGVCGGNNSECRNISDLFARRLRRGTSRVLVLPRSARNIRVESNLTLVDSPESGTSIKLGLRDRRRRFYELVSPEDRNAPKDQVLRMKGEVSTARIVVGGARFHYERSGSMETLWARGPLTTELVVVVTGATDSEIESGADVSVSSIYTIHADDLPPGGKGARYQWQLGGWGSCSKSCGGGKRVTTVACRDTQTGDITLKRHCPLMHKPPIKVEACNTFSCDFEWVPGDWEHCTATCGSHGVQQRAVFCLHGAAVEAVRSRPWLRMVNPSLCTNEKPELTRPCNRVVCPLHWELGNWTQCSASCGLGFQSQEITCPKSPTEPLSSCGVPPTTHSRPCRTNRRRDVSCELHPRPCHRDMSKYCGLSKLLGRYCVIPRFGELCCKSCQVALSEFPQYKVY